MTVPSSTNRSKDICRVRVMPNFLSHFYLYFDCLIKLLHSGWLKNCFCHQIIQISVQYRQRTLIVHIFESQIIHLTSELLNYLGSH